jgi:hypothetical protein
MNGKLVVPAFVQGRIRVHDEVTGIGLPGAEGIPNLRSPCIRRKGGRESLTERDAHVETICVPVRTTRALVPGNRRQHEVTELMQDD